MGEPGHRALLVAGTLSTLLHAGYVLLSSTGYLETRCVVDDTYYYWMVARRFWETGFFTFDGIHPTNGFQPLWQWILLPLGALSRHAQMRFSLLAAVLAYQAAAWMLALWRVRSGSVRAMCRLGALLLWINARFLFEYASSGMEFGLYLLVATWAVLEAVRFVEERSAATPRLLLRLTIAAALLPLARVDGLGLLAILWAGLWIASEPAWRPRLVIAGCVSLIPFAVYLLANHLAYDSMLPISGTVKRLDQMQVLEEQGIGLLSPAWWLLGLKHMALLLGGNVLRFHSGYLPPGPWPRVTLVAVGAIVFVLASVLALRRLKGLKSQPDELRPHFLLTVLGLFAVVQAAVYAFVIPGGTQYAQWYYGPVYLGLALLGGLALSGARLLAASLTGTALLTIHLAALAVLPQPVQIATGGLRGVVEYLDALDLPPGTRIGSWNAGLVAFRAPEHLAVVNLDGLVNSTEYARQWAVGRDKRPYLGQSGIRYLLDYGSGSRREDWRRMLVLRLAAADLEAWREFEPLYIGPPPPSGEEPRRYHLLRWQPSESNSP